MVETPSTHTAPSHDRNNFSYFNWLLCTHINVHIPTSVCFKEQFQTWEWPETCRYITEIKLVWINTDFIYCIFEHIWRPRASNSAFLSHRVLAACQLYQNDYILLNITTYRSTDLDCVQKTVHFYPRNNEVLGLSPYRWDVFTSIPIIFSVR